MIASDSSSHVVIFKQERKPQSFDEYTTLLLDIVFKVSSWPSRHLPAQS